MYDKNVKNEKPKYLSSNTLYSPKMQKDFDTTKNKHDMMYKSEGNIKKDETIVNGINSENESTNTSMESLSRKNCVSEYIQPNMIKQNSVDSIVYKNNLLLRSKTLPLKANEKVKKNLLREYRHEIRIEEELERRRKLANDEHFSSDEGWLSGPAGLQMQSDINMNNIQPNSPNIRRGRTIQISNNYERHSMSLPPREKENLLEKKKNKKKFRTLTQDPNKDCIIS